MSEQSESLIQPMHVPESHLEAKGLLLHSELPVHITHFPEEQRFLSPNLLEQSEFVEQGPQLPDEHTGAEGSRQSEFAIHWAHVPE